MISLPSQTKASKKNLLTSISKRVSRKNSGKTYLTIKPDLFIQIAEEVNYY